MTVKDLIEVLEEYNPNAKVSVNDTSYFRITHNTSLSNNKKENCEFVDFVNEEFSEDISKIFDESNYETVDEK